MATPQEATPQDELWLDDLPQVEAEAAAGMARVNFGKLSMYPRYVQWEDKMPTEVTREEWEKLVPRARSQEVVLGVDIQEFNAALEFTYERRMRIGGKDWRKTFKPSVEKIFGTDSMSKENMSATLRKIIGAYVKTEDVPQQPKRGQDASEVEYNTIKLLHVYETREKCHAAHVEQFGEQSGAGAGTDTPGWDEALRKLGWTPEGWAGQIPAMQKAYAALSGVPDKAGKVARDYGVPVECVKQALGLGIEDVVRAKDIAKEELAGIPF